MIILLVGCDLSLLGVSCSCGRCLHYLLVVYLDLSPVRGLKNFLAVGSLGVPFGADLVLPLLMVSLIKEQVFPIDGANCKD